MQASTPVPSPSSRATGRAESLAARLLAALSGRAGTAARFHEDGRWETWSYVELLRRGRADARALIALGVLPGDRVAILSATRPEWTLADLAVMWAGAVAVPIYPTSSPEECEHVLRDSGARVALCEDAGQLAKLAVVRERLPALEHVLALTPTEGTLTLDDLVERLDPVADGEVDARICALAPEDPATIVYTSGTTGAPKGCVLTHANLCAMLDMVEERLDFGDPPASFYLWLPLAHVLARAVQLVALDTGAELAYWRRDTTRLLDDVAEIRPTHLPSVPRVFEKIHAAAMAGAEQSRPRAALLRWALAVGGRVRTARERGGRPGPLLAAQHRLADRLVLARIRRLFGGRLRFAITGAAPVDPGILRFFAAAGVDVLEGYGLTECTAVATVNTVGERRLGTVGRALPGSELRIARDGELLVRGPHVFAGYHGAPEATAAAVVDGWLRTGDLADIDADGYVTITGRKKDIIITASGKNVTPASIEAELRRERWISQAVVVGDRRPYLTALITLDPAEAGTLAEQLGIAADPQALAGDERVRGEVARIVDGVNARFARPEQIKRFTILEHDLSEEAGELTPTGKVRRDVVLEHNRDAVEALYPSLTLAGANGTVARSG